MRDPDEGLTSDGLIRTGARRDRVPAAFEPVVNAAVDAVAAHDPSAELHLYGSVATGQAAEGRSDVDLVSIGLPSGDAATIAGELSERFAGVCREVAIGAAQPGDYLGGDDESYGNRVFLRHYCVPLAGADEHRSATAFPGDARAARGFNGDLERALLRWRREGATSKQVARKTLFAVAGLVSVHDGVWTTDGASAADRWSEVHPELADGLRSLREVADHDPAEWLAPIGIVETIVSQFRAVIGLWDPLTP